MFSEKIVERFWIKVDCSKECWDWTAYLNPSGYGNFNCSEGRPSKNILAHRFSWIMYFGPIPSGLMVCHKCDNPKCVRPDHLFLGTAKDNMQDMVNKGRYVSRKLPSGPNHHYYQSGIKITREQAYKIRESKKSNLELASEYGVDPSMVSKIKNGHTWI